MNAVATSLVSTSTFNASRRRSQTGQKLPFGCLLLSSRANRSDMVSTRAVRQGVRCYFVRRPFHVVQPNCSRATRHFRAAPHVQKQVETRELSDECDNATIDLLIEPAYVAHPRALPRCAAER